MIKESIETKTADAILQKPFSLQIGQRSYEVAPPSVATIIELSEAVSRLPHTTLRTDRIVEECLSVAKECRPLGEIAAILILGAKGCYPKTETVLKSGRRYLWGLIDTRKYEKVTTYPMRDLAKEILEDCTPSQLLGAIQHILGKLELSDFFGITTFLSEINLIRPTKVD